jgi:hemoglobin
MTDIVNRADIYTLVKQFYTRLLVDADLKHFFEDLDTEEELEKHLQILVDFWEHQLFYSGTYKRNALQPHLDLHHKKPITNQHFTQWLKLFTETVDKHFNGIKAHLAKAKSIATLIQIKISQL